MLFKRRTALSLRRRLRNLLWPEMGFRRTARYYRHRSIRIPASDHAIASGLAFGCAISWTLPSLHLVQSALFCWISRANWLAAFLGTALGNPWVLPALLYIDYHIGKALFISTGHWAFVHPAAGQTFGQFLKTILTEGLSLQLLGENLHQFVLPTVVGGYFMALATYPLFYYPFYFMVKGARGARRVRMEKKIHHEAAALTGQEK